LKASDAFVSYQFSPASPIFKKQLFATNSGSQPATHNSQPTNEKTTHSKPASPLPKHHSSLPPCSHLHLPFSTPHNLLATTCGRRRILVTVFDRFVLYTSAKKPCLPMLYNRQAIPISACDHRFFFKHNCISRREQGLM
jgi:hypothetical protein